MQMVNENKCSGLTVIELIVSLSIVAVISTISLVGLSSARESSRNMTCTSNQRQLGIAISAYEVAFRSLPMNVLEEPQNEAEELSKRPAVFVDHHSAHVRLLPFLDNASTFNLISFGANTNTENELKLDAPAIFRCPSESKPTSRSFNYCYSIGTQIDPAGFFKIAESENAGAFGTTESHSLNGINGLSNLIFVSERSVGSRSGNKRGWGDWKTVDFEQGNGKRDWYSIFFLGEPQSGYYTPNQWTQICAKTLDRRPIWVNTTGGMWTSGDDAYFNQIMTPNSQIPDCGMLVYPMHGCRSARSEHQRHVNVLFGDGSVRSVEDAIDLQTWRDLGAVENRDGLPERP